MRPATPLVLLALAACGPEPSSSSSAAEVAPVDAGSDAAAWCTPLNDVQTRCNVDPMLACEAHNGARPTSAYACGSWASPPGCVGFTPDNCTAMIFCCQ